MKKRILLGGHWRSTDRVEKELKQPDSPGQGPAQDTFRSKLVTYLDSQRKFRWKVVSLNGNIVARSNRTYADLQMMIRAVRRAMLLRPDVYLDSGGKWRWRVKEGKKIIASSSESYKIKGHCANSFGVFSSCVEGTISE